MPRVGRLYLVFYLEPRKQRSVLLIELHAIHVVRHHMSHELLCLIKYFLVIDQNLTDILGKIIANSANDQARVLINEEAAVLLLRSRVDGCPQLGEVLKIPVELLCASANSRGTSDDAHSAWNLEISHCVPKLCAFLPLDTSRNSATSRVFWHQYKISTCETDEGGKCCAFGSSFVFLNLDNHFLPNVHNILDANFCWIGFRLIEIGS